MSADLRVSVGELGFAIGVVATLRHALDFVRGEIDVADDSNAHGLLTASGHSLLARQLAVQGDHEVRLAPPLRAAAEIAASAEWAVRCERLFGGRVERLVFHLAPTGMLAQAVEDEVVFRLSLESDVTDLVDRAGAFFDLSDTDAESPARIERGAMAELGQLDARADIAAELNRRGVPKSMSARFAADLASARWKGTVAKTYGGKSESPRGDLMLVLVAGAQTWFIDTGSPDFAMLGIASRHQFGERAESILNARPPRSGAAFTPQAR